jgi:uncharacterized protein with HEPN domain
MPSTRSKSPATALRDIVENIDLARGFVKDLSFDEFQADRRTVYAVVRCLEIISEAARRLPEDLKARHPQIPWTDIAGAGSIYRHDYHNVRDIFVWRTIEQNLEPLRNAAEHELRKLVQ